MSEEKVLATFRVDQIIYSIEFLYSTSNLISFDILSQNHFYSYPSSHPWECLGWSPEDDAHTRERGIKTSRKLLTGSGYTAAVFADCIPDRLIACRPLCVIDLLSVGTFLSYGTIIVFVHRHLSSEFIHLTAI